jgi:hypothetical protein
VKEVGGRDDLTIGEAMTAASWLEAAVPEVLRQLVAMARDQGGTWTEIGEALGVSAQAAHQRFRVSER